MHQADSSCHTLIPVERMRSHLHHGGGFKLEVSEGTTDFSGLDGLFVADFRCAVCGEKVRMHAGVISMHLRPHYNLNRRMEPGGTFFMTLSELPPYEP